jgi:excisionase family DNA binding protein
MPEEHTLWMGLADETTDKSRRMRGVGYRAGLEGLDVGEAMERMKKAHGPRLYTTQELAQLLSVSIHTIHNEIKRGKLPQRMVGRAYRFTEDDVEEYLRKR